MKSLVNLLLITVVCSVGLAQAMEHELGVDEKNQHNLSDRTYTYSGNISHKDQHVFIGVKDNNGESHTLQVELNNARLKGIQQPHVISTVDGDATLNFDPTKQYIQIPAFNEYISCAQKEKRVKDFLFALCPSIKEADSFALELQRVIDCKIALASKSVNNDPVKNEFYKYRSASYQKIVDAAQKELEAKGYFGSHYYNELTPMLIVTAQKKVQGRYEYTTIAVPLLLVNNNISSGYDNFFENNRIRKSQLPIVGVDFGNVTHDVILPESDVYCSGEDLFSAIEKQSSRLLSSELEKKLGVSNKSKISVVCKDNLGSEIQNKLKAYHEAEQKKAYEKGYFVAVSNKQDKDNWDSGKCNCSLYMFSNKGVINYLWSVNISASAVVDDNVIDTGTCGFSSRDLCKTEATVWQGIQDQDKTAFQKKTEFTNLFNNLSSKQGPRFFTPTKIALTTLGIVSLGLLMYKQSDLFKNFFARMSFGSLLRGWFKK